MDETIQNGWSLHMLGTNWKEGKERAKRGNRVDKLSGRKFKDKFSLLQHFTTGISWNPRYNYLGWNAWARVNRNLSVSTNYLIKQSRWRCESKIVTCNRIMWLKASAVMECRESKTREKNDTVLGTRLWTWLANVKNETRNKVLLMELYYSRKHFLRINIHLKATEIKPSLWMSRGQGQDCEWH